MEIFISYSRKDSDIADKICSALDRAHITYFIDRKGIGGGMEVPDVLAKAIKDCDIFLLLASKNSYESKFTKSEIQFAYNEKSEAELLPYLIDDTEMPTGLRLIFSRINWRHHKSTPIEPDLINDILSLLGKGQSAESDSTDIQQKEESLEVESSSDKPDLIDSILTDTFGYKWKFIKSVKKHISERGKNLFSKKS